MSNSFYILSGKQFGKRFETKYYSLDEVIDSFGLIVEEDASNYLITNGMDNSKFSKEEFTKLGAIKEWIYNYDPAKEYQLEAYEM
jgi:hypothetical protein